MIELLPECFVIKDGMTDKEILEGLKTHSAYIDLREKLNSPLPVEIKKKKELEPKTRFRKEEIGEIKI